MVNDRFYSNDDIKLDMYYISKRRYPVVKNNSSVLFIECTEINWETTDENSFFVSIFLKNMVWYLGVIVKFHNNECII